MNYEEFALTLGAAPEVTKMRMWVWQLSRGPIRFHAPHVVKFEDLDIPQTSEEYEAFTRVPTTPTLTRTTVDQQQTITEQNQTIADLKQKITEQNQKIEDQDKTLKSVVQELLIKTIGKVCFACNQQGFTPGSAPFTPGPHNRPASFDVFHDCHICFSKISGLSEGRVGQPQ